MTVPELAGQPAYRLYQWAWAGLDWFFPPHCGGCGRRVGARYCPACLQNTRLIRPPVCSRCGLQGRIEGMCRACESAAPSYTALRSWAVFDGPLRNALHRLKYAGAMPLGAALARPLAALLAELGWQPDLLAPVPLGVVHRAQRGYNQATILALPVALSRGVSFRPQALFKTRDTRSQVGLSAQQRRLNVDGAFCARPALVEGRRVLVVDDVTTSGATIEACAQALLQAGAQEVYGLTQARAPLPAARSRA